MENVFLSSIIQLIHYLIRIYILIIIVRSVISWIGNIPPNKFIYILRKLTDPVFYFVHKYLPFTVMGGIDISPVIIILALYFIDSIIIKALYTQALGVG